MFKNLLSVGFLGLAVAAPLLAVGCATDKPYSLSGTSTIDEQERKERLRWTDDKGHYRPDLRMQRGAPRHYIP